MQAALKPWHVHRTALHQDCYLLGYNGSHSYKYYRRFDRRSVNMCNVMQPYVSDGGSPRSQLRISGAFVKRSIKVTWNPDVQKEKSIVKWFVRHLHTAMSHILCHLDSGRVFRTSFVKIHFNNISIRLILVYYLHLFLPRLCMRFLSLPHVLCTSFFVSFVAIILLASCEEWNMVKSARIIKNQTTKMCGNCRCSCTHS